MSSSKVIGIDFGSSFSSVAVFKNDQVEVVSNYYSNRRTPSVVTFSDRQILVGEAAQNEQARNRTNTVYGMKRLLGRKFTEKCVQDDIRLWPFVVVADNEDKPKIEINVRGTVTLYSPEQISAEILKHLKHLAERRLGYAVKHAVITVPAYFNSMQKLAVIAAATIAELNVVELLHEPTATVIAHELPLDFASAHKTVLVFDMGGRSVAVTVLLVNKNGSCTVKAMVQDANLGGDDLDSCLVEHFASVFDTVHQTNVRQNAKAMHKLREACEHAKRSLSTNKVAPLQIDSLLDGNDFYIQLERDQFETICKPVIDKVAKPMLEVLMQTLRSKELHVVLMDSDFSDASWRPAVQALFKKAQINAVIMVGGSSHVLKIQQTMENFMGKSTDASSDAVDENESVVRGAAIRASKHVVTDSNFENVSHGMYEHENETMLEEDEPSSWRWTALKVILVGVALGTGIAVNPLTVLVTAPVGVAYILRK